MRRIRALRVASAMAISILVAGLVASCAGPMVMPTPTEELTREPTPQVPPANASLGDTWIRPADGAVIVYVPAGEFLYGPGSMTSIPEQRIHLDAFWIDRTEVTNVQYAHCVADGGCSEPLYTVPYEDPARANHPVIWISRGEAEEYCKWAGARLPMRRVRQAFSIVLAVLYHCEVLARMHGMLR